MMLSIGDGVAIATVGISAAAVLIALIKSKSWSYSDGGNGSGGTRASKGNGGKNEFVTKEICGIRMGTIEEKIDSINAKIDKLLEQK